MIKTERATICEVDWATGCGRMHPGYNKMICTVKCFPEYFLLIVAIVVVIIVVWCILRKKKQLSSK